MASYRPESVGRNIQQQLSEILRTEIRDPRLLSITLTGVKMSRDLRTARVYFSIPGEEPPWEEALEGLENAAAFLRREIGQRVRLRHIPELFFSYDDSIERGARIDRLLNDLNS